MTTILNAKKDKSVTYHQQPSIKTNSAALVNALEDVGVQYIFGYPGAAVLSIYNELADSSIRHVLVRHEQAAVHMAEGYARIGNSTGVVLVTSGPGLTNTITGIANAYADSVPLVILAGDVNYHSSKKGKIFQKVDIIDMTKTCCKKSYKVSSKDDVVQIIHEAFDVANSGIKGPVVISLARNVLESKYHPNSSKRIKENKHLTSCNHFEYDKAIKLILKAKRPILLLGKGSEHCVNEIDDFVNIFNIPVVSTLMGIGIFPSNNKLYKGMIGMNGNPLANSLLNNSDLIIALGVGFSDRTICKNKHFAKNAKIINVNITKTKKHHDLNILSDVKPFLTYVINKSKNLNIPQNDTWHGFIQTLSNDTITTASRTPKIHSSKVLKLIYDYTKDYEPVVVTDVGQHQMLTAQFFNFTKPRKFITSGGLGTMGFGLPAAIGCHIANPNNLVLNITGDGSFQMNLQELATCREHNIPIKIIIMNNGYLGMVRQMQEKIYKRRYQVEMINPDFTKIAEAYDLYAQRVTKTSNLLPALKNAIEYNGTAIIDIAIDSFEEI